MAKIADEFKEFISKGNVMDMAVGIIIGGAFTGIVNSLVADLIQPLIEAVSGGGTEISGLVVPGTHIDFGAFISACINFFIIALVVFALVKSVNKLREATDKLTKKEKEEEEEAEPRKCPFCCEEIADEASRCPHCTAELPETA